MHLHWGSLAAVGTLLIMMSSAWFSVVVSPMQESLSEIRKMEMGMEVRVRALEISDARTGVNLEALTKSIDRLVNKMDDQVPRRNPGS